MSSKVPPPRRQTTIPQTGTPWYVTLFATLVIGLIAYVLSAFAYLLLEHISRLPRGPLWDVSFQAPFLFVMLTIVVILLAVPYFNKEWDRGLRTFSLFAAIFLIAFAIFRQSTNTPFNPDIPLEFFMDKVFTPLHHLIGY